MKTRSNTLLITGGSSGIGLGFAKEFLCLGNKVIICARGEDRLNKVKEQYPEMIIRRCDVSIAKEREELYDWIKENHADMNVLVNNAGVQLNTNITEALDLKRLSSEMDTNLIAPIHLSSLFINLLETKKESAIINITSGLAFAPLAFMPVYCATKAALHSLTLSLRHQLKNTSIKMQAISGNVYEAAIGQAKGLRLKREELFNVMNK